MGGVFLALTDLNSNGLFKQEIVDTGVGSRKLLGPTRLLSESVFLKYSLVGSMS